MVNGHQLNQMVVSVAAVVLDMESLLEQFNVTIELAFFFIPLVKMTQSSSIVWEGHQLSSSKAPVTPLFSVTI